MNMRVPFLLILTVVVGIPSFAQSDTVFIKGGDFQLNDKMESVHVSDLYWMKHKITIGQWKQFIAEAYPTFKFSGILEDIYNAVAVENLNDKWPIVGITWLEAVKYCNWLSRKHGRQPVYTIKGDLAYSYYYSDEQRSAWPLIEINLKANGYRLPSWEEWQFAAKGGLEGIKLGWWKDVRKLKSYGFFLENSKMEMQPVGSLLPNPCGLYDMVGLVQEWTNNAYTGRVFEHGTIPGSIRIVAGATLYYSYYQRPTIVENGKSMQPPGVPDYFSENDYYNEWQRVFVGFRLVTTSP